MVVTDIADHSEMLQKHMMKSGLISDFDIQALVDNQNHMEPAERDRILTAIEKDPSLRKRYEELKKQKSLLQSWWEENKNETLQ